MTLHAAPVGTSTSQSVDKVQAVDLFTERNSLLPHRVGAYPVSRVTDHLTCHVSQISTRDTQCALQPGAAQYTRSIQVNISQFPPFHRIPHLILANACLDGLLRDRKRESAYECGISGELRYKVFGTKLHDSNIWLWAQRCLRPIRLWPKQRCLGHFPLRQRFWSGGPTYPKTSAQSGGLWIWQHDHDCILLHVAVPPERCFSSWRSTILTRASRPSIKHANYNGNVEGVGSDFEPRFGTQMQAPPKIINSHAKQLFFVTN